MLMLFVVISKQCMSTSAHN